MTIEIPLSQQGKHAGKYVAIVDDIDADLAELNWVVKFCKHRKCPQRAGRWNNAYDVRVFEYIHRVIVEDMLGRRLNPDEMIDHINGDGLDNRRCNLRIVSRQTISATAHKRRNVSSQYKGVSWLKANKKWVSQIVVNGEHIYLGLFESEHEAHLAYVKASRELFGEFANGG